mgnify:CR=1 FL=1
MLINFSFLSKVLLVSFFIVSVFLLSPSLSAKQKFRFEHYSLKEGLSQSVVYSSVQDSQGYLWFSTQDGLNRFDGYRFKVYQHNKNVIGSLPSNYGNVLYIDNEETLWYGSIGGGLSYYNRTTDTFTTYLHNQNNQNSLSGNDVKAIIEDDQKNLWVGTANNGLNKFDRKNNIFEHYKKSEKSANSLSDNHISTLFIDSKETLWVGTVNGGLNKFDERTGTFTSFKFNPSNINSLPDNHVVSITETSDGTLWLGTNFGLAKLSLDNDVVTRISNFSKKSGVSTDAITAVYADRHDVLWIATYSHGMTVYDYKHNHYDTYQHVEGNRNALLTNYIHSLYQDEMGIFWFGTYGGGVSKLNPKTALFDNATFNSQILKGKIVLGIIEDKQNNLWVGSYQFGVTKFSPGGNVTQFIHSKENSNSISSNFIWALFEDSSGNIWIGTDNDGLNKLTPKTGKITRYQHEPSNVGSLASNTVLAITEDEEGYIWIGTKNGLDKLTPLTGQIEHYRYNSNDEKSLSANQINSLTIDSENKLYISTMDGINIYDRQKNNFEHSNQYAHKIRSLYKDNQGYIWVGTSGEGLHKYDNNMNHLQQYTTKNGLPNDTVYGVIEDENNYLWLSTNYGISRFDPKTSTFTNFDITDGLFSNEFNQNTHLKSKKNKILLGNMGGLNVFSPEDLDLVSDSVPVVFTRFLINNQEVWQEQIGNSSLSKPISLDYDKRNFSIEFAALDYRNPKRIEYQYKLTGYDDEWHNTSADERRATYTNLGSGTYKFTVKATNSYGIWNRESAELYITILSAWWLTWWMKSIYILSFILSIYLFIRFRTELHKQRSAVLEVAILERTEALVTAQKTIVSQEKMSSLGTLTAGVAHEINNPTNFVHAAVYMMKDETSVIKAYLKQLAGGDNADEAVLKSFDEKFRKLIGLIETATEGTTRIKTIVNDLRTYSRLDEATKRNVHLASILASTIHLVKTQYDTIEINVDTAADPKLECFPAKLSQVFMNVTVNACQAIITKQQNEDELLGKITISVIKHQDLIEIIFKDNGCGMNSITQKKIFDPFFTTKDVGNGTGLGMAISFGIIEDHRGTLKVSSMINKGSTITICLPIK